MVDEKDLDLIRNMFDDRYRKIDDCNDLTAAIDRREDKMESAFNVVSTKMNIMISILVTIAVPIVGGVVKMLLFGGA